MTTYVVARPFEGRAVGDKVEIPDPRRADILRRRRYVTPLNEGGGSSNTEVVVKAVSLIAVSKLDEFLAVVSSTTALTAALEAETRDTAVPLIEARLEELAG